MKLEMNIPLDFFGSANVNNDFESVSEKIAKKFLTDILCIKDVKRGDDKKNEPDYIASNKGYEVTLAVEQSLIPQLKGIKPLENKKRCVETELINNIIDAIERKKTKKYSCKTSLIIISLDFFPLWYIFQNRQCEDLFDTFPERVVLKSRNDLFDNIYENCIKSDIFENVYIIQPALNQELALYNIYDFKKHPERFITIVTPNKPHLFPTFKTIDPGKVSEVKNFEITSINHIH